MLRPEAAPASERRPATAAVAGAVDLPRWIFQLLALGGLIATSFWILRPFLASSVWAATIVIATWPLLCGIEGRLGGRRLATAVMTSALLVLLVAPVYAAVSILVRHAGAIGEWSQALATISIPEPPAWLAGLPLFGDALASRWHALAAETPAELSARLEPWVQTLLLWFAGQVGNIGLLLAQLLLTVVIAGLLYANGERAADAVGRFARRLAGARGEQALRLAAQAVRAVALGVVGTAVVQAGLGGLGLAVAGVPFALVATAAMFMLAIAQIGAAPVLFAATIWVYLQHGTVWGSCFLGWAIACSVLDNVLRPLLIRRGADLPLLLIFAGVIGGLLAFGVIGLFIGPVVLAVAHTLLGEWLAQGDAPTEEGLV